MVAAATVDLDALRRQRLRPGMGNLLSRQRLECFREIYSGSVYPANSLLDSNGSMLVPERRHFINLQKQVIATLQKRGVLPATQGGPLT
jgi:hypothetical protein